ncbi:type II toxin-antitoxin system antitoxin DNA ADP-ribosyl glycohydrolase DarG [Hydrocarboniphaga sp.]|uniref:type II toxin-antitoxin system antitoxin DNA ADP-ribosyl glycohydrolase DarG n=1 Tax=Hydrocarboniphaga sp. TaxID=2033016 RepID=UPI003D0E028C
MIKALIGDLFESRAQALVNTVNCVGVMGKGVAEQFKLRYPAMFDDYKRRCDQKIVKLGRPYLYRDTTGLAIINFPTKDHWRSPSKLSDIEAGLDHLAVNFAEWGITSIAMPPLGCGNGGLDWSEVGPLIHRKLHRLPLQVEVYAPYTTPKSQLTEEFLAAPSQMSLEGKGRKAEKLNPDWVVLLEVLRELQVQPYANPVGRTIFQKICYVVTEMGVPTGFSFGKGSYGPFSDDVKSALHELSNRNWLHEEQLGRMLALRVGQPYEKDRGKFLEVVQRHQKKIDKIVDLFSRIKSTEQAEEVMTVLYASRQLKHGVAQADLEEQQIFDYIIGWKKTWNTAEKQATVANAIRNLVMLGWMRARISESMIQA